MKTKENTIFQKYKSLDFGKITLTEPEQTTYKILTDQMLYLCHSLPPSMQNQSLLFLMNYAGINLGQPLELFKNYYAPAWTIIHHMSTSNKSTCELTTEEHSEAMKIQAMAMFLHSLDDHMVDVDINPSHQMLLLRSQAWMLMIDSIKKFSDKNPEANSIAEKLIDNYYDGITTKEKPDTIEEYCNLFRKQMATWTIVPVLTAKKFSNNEAFAQDIQKAYESFGIAWRLLDDINDIEDDIKDNTHSSVYLALDKKGREIWDNKNMDDIENYISKNQIIETLTQQICSELENSKNLTLKYNMKNLANQYETMAGPLKTWLQTKKNES